VIVYLAVWPSLSPAYSVLTHETSSGFTVERSDSTVASEAFPQGDYRRIAEGPRYAYGGCVLQTWVIIPSVINFSAICALRPQWRLRRDAASGFVDLNEYAFALRSVVTLWGDKWTSNNQSYCCSVEFPKLKKKYGDNVTYADDPKATSRPSSDSTCSGGKESLQLLIAITT